MTTDNTETPELLDISSIMDGISYGDEVGNVQKIEFDPETENLFETVYLGGLLPEWSYYDDEPTVLDATEVITRTQKIIDDNSPNFDDGITATMINDNVSFLGRRTIQPGDERYPSTFTPLADAHYPQKDWKPVTAPVPVDNEAVITSTNGWQEVMSTEFSMQKTRNDVRIGNLKSWNEVEAMQSIVDLGRFISRLELPALGYPADTAHRVDTHPDNEELMIVTIFLEDREPVQFQAKAELGLIEKYHPRNQVN